jgi:hypothetical protein
MYADSLSDSARYVRLVYTGADMYCPRGAGCAGRVCLVVVVAMPRALLGCWQLASVPPPFACTLMPVCGHHPPCLRPFPCRHLMLAELMVWVNGANLAASKTVTASTPANGYGPATDAK